MFLWVKKGESAHTSSSFTVRAFEVLNSGSTNEKVDQPQKSVLSSGMVFELEDGCTPWHVSISPRCGLIHAPRTAFQRFERAILLARGTSLLATPTGSERTVAPRRARPCPIARRPIQHSPSIGHRAPQAHRPRKSTSEDTAELPAASRALARTQTTIDVINCVSPRRAQICVDAPKPGS